MSECELSRALASAELQIALCLVVVNELEHHELVMLTDNLQRYAAVILMPEAEDRLCYREQKAAVACPNRECLLLALEEREVFLCIGHFPSFRSLHVQCTIANEPGRSIRTACASRCK